ncbi:hypothetical protein [Asticcacaulis sp. MM231]|uniref:hypothetical protein n=1 Tax=Asticcacaulis sp. MM231 TaxID=3157666 RepID=UPI0032D56E18
MMNLRLYIVLAALGLSGCNRIADLLEKPETGPTRVIPAPPGDGDIRLYPPLADAKDQSPAAQVRAGDCAKTVCFQWGRKHWKPLPKTDVKAEAYLSVMMPSGSDYSPDIWRPIESTGKRVLVSSAGVDGVARGLFDGLRIGLQDTSGATYFTAYSVESGDLLKARGLCTRDMATDAGNPAKAGCAEKVGPDRYILPFNGDVVIASGKVWLLHRRPDRSSNRVDLFDLPRGPAVCLPGLIIDTEGKWMGPPEAALSPDLFVSRSRPSAEYEAHKAKLLKACS